MNADPATGTAPRWHAGALLLVMTAAYLVFAWHYVPRLNNYVMSDREFTGWTGPIAERLVAGDRPYLDFVLPIPPGSFVLMAAIQRVAGRAVLLQELWVAALSQLVLAWLGYAIARTVVAPRVAAFVAVATLVTLIQLPKECVYDHTAQVVAWSSIAAGARAFASGVRRRRTLLWTAAGFAATFTLGFKQSTAMGLLVGWGLAFGYGALVLRNTRLSWREDARSWALGAAGGTLAVAGLVVASGSTVPAFLQAVFLDASEVKGGRLSLVRTLLSHLVMRPAFSGSLLVTSALFALAVLVHRRGGAFATDDTVDVRGGVGVPMAGAVAVVAGFVGAAVLLWSGPSQLPQWLAPLVHRTGELPGAGLVFLAVFFVVHVAGSAPDERVFERRHAFDALVIVALGTSLLHDASFDQFGTFYNNNPIIPLAFAAIFAVVIRARIRGAFAVAFVVALCPIAGRKFERALSADTEVGSAGHWAGLRVNYRGRVILQAAARARELAGPDETVLVLPEDVQLAGLIGRPRPPLRGAILFVDQYPKRLLEHDLRSLRDHPPKVIVIHPRSERDWRRLFATWNEQSAAATVMEFVTTELLPSRYRLDSSHPTVHFWDQGQLDVHVRID